MSAARSSILSPLRREQKNYDLSGAVWTLRRYPLDLINRTMLNSPGLDTPKLAENFRGQQLVELLLPGARRIMRWNGHPFMLDGRIGGRAELAGDEFNLLDDAGFEIN